MALTERLAILIDARGEGALKTFEDLGKGAGKLEEQTTKAGDTMKKALAGGALIAGAALGKMIKDGMAALADQQKIDQQTNAVLKSTGSAAGVTAKHVSDLADSVKNYGAVDDDAVKSMENLILTFTNIRNEAGKGNDVFDQTVKITADMSRALGQDLNSSAILVGKALNDPIKGLTALTRVGVSFTEQQKQQIKTLVESGNTLQAQKVILTELNREFGGSAKAYGDSAAGAMDKVKNAFSDMEKALAKPIFDPIASGMQKVASVANFLSQHPMALNITEGFVGAAALIVGVNKAIGLYKAAKESEIATLARSTLAKRANTAATVTEGDAELATAAKTSTASGKIASAAGKAGLVTAVAATLGFGFRELNQHLAGTAPSVDKLTASLVGFADTGQVSGYAADKFGKDLGGLKDSLKEVADPSIYEQISHIAGKLATFGGDSNGMIKARQNTEAFDQTLANLVSAGHADIAAQLVAKVGVSASTANKALPKYTDALAQNTTQAQLDAGATSGLASGLDDAKESTDAAATATKNLYDELNKLQTQVQSVASSQLSLESAEFSVHSATDGVAQAAQTLAQAQRDHGVASAEAKQAEDGLTQSLLSAKQSFLAAADNARQAALAKLGDADAATQASVGNKAYRDELAKLAAGIAPGTPLRVYLDGLIGQLDNAGRDRTANIVVHVDTSQLDALAAKGYSAGQLRLLGRASGGPVAAGTPYIIGERGPELFVPRQSGTVVPNHALTGSGLSVGQIVVQQAPGEDSGSAVVRHLRELAFEAAV